MIKEEEEERVMATKLGPRVLSYAEADDWQQNHPSMAYCLYKDVKSVDGRQPLIVGQPGPRLTTTCLVPCFHPV